MTIRPPSAVRAQTPRCARSSLAASRTLIGHDLHAQRRRHGLDYRELPDPGGDGGVPKDRRARHARRDLLEQLQPFAAELYSNCMKPVALPPGRARLSTKPAPTGSGTMMNTIGMVRVACSNGVTTGAAGGQDDVRRERDQFGRIFANASASPPLQRVSIRTLRPSVQPNCCNPCTNAAKRACAVRDRRASAHEHADRAARAPCARAASGQPPPHHREAG